jgi:hypothetical protein
VGSCCNQGIQNKLLKNCSQLYNSQPLLTTHLSSRIHEGLVSHPDNFPYSSSITPLLLLLLLLLRPPFSVTEEESQPTSQPIPPPTKRSSKNPSIDLCNVFQKWVYESNLCVSGSESL